MNFDTRARFASLWSTRSAFFAACLVGAALLTACAGGGGASAQPTERELRMAPERIFDAERPFMRGNPVGIELHWWLARDANGDIARALAPHDRATEFLPQHTRERLRLSGIRVVAVPLSEVFILHQIAPPRSGWSRRWLGQEPDWVQLVRTRRIEAGTRSAIYGSEQRLPEGILRMVGRGWMQPRSTQTDDGPRIEPVMHLQLAAQVQQRDPDRERENRFVLPAQQVRLPISEQGPFIDELALELTVPHGYAIILTTDRPESDWSGVEAVTRENLIAEIQRRETQGTADDEAASEASGSTARFGPSPSAPTEVQSDAEDEAAQVFETLDAPMPSLAESFGPPASPVPTVGQLMLETRDSLSRPLRGVVILIPRLPDEFRLLP